MDLKSCLILLSVLRVSREILEFFAFAYDAHKVAIHSDSTYVMAVED